MIRRFHRTSAAPTAFVTQVSSVVRVAAQLGLQSKTQSGGAERPERSGGGGGRGFSREYSETNPVPAYRKPPPAPAGAPIATHLGGGTGHSDPYIRRDPNQPTRAPESAILSSQSGMLILTQAERADPRLLADRRFPLGEWLRRGPASSPSLLQMYLSSLMLPVQGPPLGQAQQQMIDRFEEETIAEASVAASREPSIEKARWHGIASKFTSHLHLFDPAAFELHLDVALQKQVLGFFDGDASYEKELSDVFFILRNNAIVVRNHRLRELISGVVGISGGQAAALEEGGLVWDRFFAIVEQKKETLIRLSSAGGNSSSSKHQQEAETQALEAMWLMSRESATPLLSPALALLFISTTANTAAALSSLASRTQPALKRLLEEQLSSRDDTALWAPATGAVSRFITRDELFRYVSKNIAGFLSRMDGVVVEQLRAAGFADLADEAANAVMEKEAAAASSSAVQPVPSSSSSSSSPAKASAPSPTSSRQQLVADVATAFKRIQDAHSAVQSIVQNPASAHSVIISSSPSSSSSGPSSSTTIRGFILELLQTLVPPERKTAMSAATTTGNISNPKRAAATGGYASSGDLQQLFAALAPSWDAVHERFTISLLSNVHVTKMLAEANFIKGMSSGSERTRELMQNVWTSERIREALKRLVQLDAIAQERTDAAVKNIRVKILSSATAAASSAAGDQKQQSTVLPRAARMILRAKRAQVNNNRNSGGGGGYADGAEILSLIRARIAQATAETAAPQWLAGEVVRKIAGDYPSWSPVIISPADLSGNYAAAAAAATSQQQSYLSAEDEALCRHALLFRIYLRLTYVPHAANAVLTSRHRRRIGQIATKPHQFNLEAEVGFAEEYNTKEHKQWDWQGWYQRMMDVFHRNVSLRLRLSDMRARLDNNGRPFVDLQSERRLRVLAAERVGGGVLKLDSDRFEDRSDNLDYGTGKLQQVLTEAKKAQLGREYWPTVEVKVREPSGQSKMHYSLLDWDRVEQKSLEMLDKYRAAKERSVFVPPTATWLEAGGSGRAGSAKTVSATVDSDGYTVEASSSAATTPGKRK